MIRFILKVLKFFVVFILVLAGTSFIISLNPDMEEMYFGKYGNTPAYTSVKIKDWDNWKSKLNDKERLIILGPSSAYRAINPGVLDSSKYDAFNLASSGQTLEISYELLKSTYRVKPLDILILDFSPICWELHTYNESVIDLTNNNNNLLRFELLSLNFHSFSTKMWFSYLYFFFKRNIYRINDLSETDKFISEKGYYAGKGFVYSTRQCNPSDKMVYGGQRLNRRLTIDNKSLSGIKNIIMFCSRNKIKLYCYTPPTYPRLDFRIPSILNGMNYIDANEIDMKKTDFYDNVHLKGGAAAKFSRKLFSNFGLID